MDSSYPRFHIWGKSARTGHHLKLPSLTKLARLGHFPPASQAGRLAGPVFYTISFLWIQPIPTIPAPHLIVCSAGGAVMRSQCLWAYSRPRTAPARGRGAAQPCAPTASHTLIASSTRISTCASTAPSSTAACPTSQVKECC